MRSEFVITSPAGLERVTYEADTVEGLWAQFRADYSPARMVREGISLSYTRSLDAIVPLVKLGA